jgi:putative ABC transport system ATP-binding protein
LSLQNGHIGLRDGDRSFRLQVRDFSLAAGQTVALTGASGSGKTLLLELLGLLRAPGSGTRYRWGGQDGLDLAALWTGGPRSADLARARGRLFGFVPQAGGLLPFLSVSENIALSQQLNGKGDDTRCRMLIDRLGLSDVAALYPGALSIGQRQRTAIARAVAHRPAFVIADEPTAALDSHSADAVLDLLLDVAGTEGSGVILSSHDVDRIARFAIPMLRLSVRTVGHEVTSAPEDITC